MDIDEFYGNLFGTYVCEAIVHRTNLVNALPNLKIFHTIRESLSVRSMNAIRSGETRQMIVEAYMHSSLIKSTRATLGETILKPLYYDLAQLIKHVSAATNIFEMPNTYLELLVDSLGDNEERQFDVESTLVHQLLNEIRSGSGSISQNARLAVQLTSKLNPHALVEFATRSIDRLEPQLAICIIEWLSQEMNTRVEKRDQSQVLVLVEKFIKKFRHDGSIILSLVPVLRASKLDFFSCSSSLIDKILLVLKDLGLSSIKYEIECLEMNVKSLGQNRQSANQILSRIFCEFNQRTVFIKLKTVDLLIDKFFSTSSIFPEVSRK